MKYNKKMENLDKKFIRYLKKGVRINKSKNYFDNINRV